MVYTIVFGFGSYYLAKLLRNGPDVVDETPIGGDRLSKKPKRPFSLPDESLGGPPGRQAPQPAE